MFQSSRCRERRVHLLRQFFDASFDILGGKVDGGLRSRVQTETTSGFDRPVPLESLLS